MSAITSQWWRRLVIAYGVKAGMVCLQCKNSVIHSASDVSFSGWDAIQIYVPLPLWSIKLPLSSQEGHLVKIGPFLQENYHSVGR